MNPPHYPSLELCNKLTEIGFPETEKWYLWGWNDFNIIKNREWFLHWVSSFLCPSVMEMLDVMPWKISRWENMLSARLIIEKSEVSYEFLHKVNVAIWVPEALAEMILWLYENNHLSFKK